MLILSRKVGRKIRIGNNVVVTIVAVTGCDVQVGVDAPRDVSVRREEVWLRDQAADEDAPEMIS